MTSLKICMLALLCVALALIVKQWKGDFLPLLHVGTVVVFGIFAIGAIAPVVSYLKTLIGASAATEHVGILLKALCVAILTHICADICRECGEGAAATGVELTGKAEILLLSLPLVNEILEAAQQLLTLGG